MRFQGIVESGYRYTGSGYNGIHTLLSLYRKLSRTRQGYLYGSKYNAGRISGFVFGVGVDDLYVSRTVFFSLRGIGYYMLLLFPVLAVPFVSDLQNG
jgi:hypothetical protein